VRLELLVTTKQCSPAVASKQQRHSTEGSCATGQQQQEEERERIVLCILLYLSSAYCEHSVAQVNTKVCTMSSPLYIVVYVYGTCSEYSEQHDTFVFNSMLIMQHCKGLLLRRAQPKLCAVYNCS
jgi:hypothetical protein